jgi:hypothetical protein
MGLGSFHGSAGVGVGVGVGVGRGGNAEAESGGYALDVLVEQQQSREETSTVESLSSRVRVHGGGAAWLVMLDGSGGRGVPRGILFIIYINEDEEAHPPWVGPSTMTFHHPNP